MRDGIIYDFPHADCRTPIYTGKCRRECLERYNKEMGSKPKTNADRIRAMSDEELVKLLSEFSAYSCIFHDKDCEFENCVDCVTHWLKQPAEGE